MKFDFAVPIVSAVIERERDGEIEVLVQTRWKPDKDPQEFGPTSSFCPAVMTQTPGIRESTPCSGRLLRGSIVPRPHC
jgi:hypothetical protein